MIFWCVYGSSLHNAIGVDINTSLERRLVRAFNLARLAGSLVLDMTLSPNPETPARIVFQDRGELAEFQKGRSGRDIGPNPNAAGQQPSGRHLW